MARGDHIRVKRQGYWHHGIDCGDGTVIHYSGEVYEKRGASVRRTSFDAFARGGAVRRVHYRACDAPDRVVARAESRLDDANYHLLDNNCEHFARWCKTGRKSSKQVDRVTQAVGIAMFTLTAVATLVSRLRRTRV